MGVSNKFLFCFISILMIYGFCLSMDDYKKAPVQQERRQQANIVSTVQQERTKIQADVVKQARATDNAMPKDIVIAKAEGAKIAEATKQKEDAEKRLKQLKEAPSGFFNKVQKFFGKVIPAFDPMKKAESKVQSPLYSRVDPAAPVDLSKKSVVEAAVEMPSTPKHIAPVSPLPPLPVPRGLPGPDKTLPSSQVVTSEIKVPLNQPEKQAKEADVTKNKNEQVVDVPPSFTKQKEILEKEVAVAKGIADKAFADAMVVKAAADKGNDGDLRKQAVDRIGEAKRLLEAMRERATVAKAFFDDAVKRAVENEANAKRTVEEMDKAIASNRSSVKRYEEKLVAVTAKFKEAKDKLENNNTPNLVAPMKQILDARKRLLATVKSHLKKMTGMVTDLNGKFVAAVKIADAAAKEVAAVKESADNATKRREEADAKVKEAEANLAKLAQSAVASPKTVVLAPVAPPIEEAAKELPAKLVSPPPLSPQAAKDLVKTDPLTAKSNVDPTIVGALAKRALATQGDAALGSDADMKAAQKELEAEKNKLAEKKADEIEEARQKVAAATATAKPFLAQIKEGKTLKSSGTKASVETEVVKQKELLHGLEIRLAPVIAEIQKAKDAVNKDRNNEALQTTLKTAESAKTNLEKEIKDAADALSAAVKAEAAIKTAEAARTGGVAGVLAKKIAVIPVKPEDSKTPEQIAAEKAEWGD